MGKIEKVRPAAWHELPVDAPVEGQPSLLIKTSGEVRRLLAGVPAVQLGAWPALDAGRASNGLQIAILERTMLI